MRSNMLTTTNFDSAALYGFASIAHSLREAGHWRLEIHNIKNLLIWHADVVVRDGGQSKLAVQLQYTTESNTCCIAREQVIAPGGMISLNGTTIERGGGFALLFRGKSNDPIWDSRVLTSGDYFACMPLRPGRYRVNNLLDGAQCSLHVNYPDPRRTVQGLRLASDPIHIKVGRTLVPGELCIDPGQLLVFAIEAKSHLTVTLEATDDGPSELAEWRALRGRQVLEAAFVQRACKPKH